MFNNILLILPENNFNEQEFNTVKTHLERNALKVFIASDATGLCSGEFGLKVKPDVKLFNIHISNFKAIVFIGGNGIKEYWNNTTLHSVAKKSLENKILVGAICGAPVILAKAGVLHSKNAVCFPDHMKELTREGINYIDLPVVKDGKIITAQNENAAQEFSENLISAI